MCLRMGGDAPHLGRVLTEGSLSGYSVEFRIVERSLPEDMCIEGGGAELFG